MWMHGSKGKVFQVNVRTEDLTPCIIKDQGCNLLNHSCAPVGIDI